MKTVYKKEASAAPITSYPAALKQGDGKRAGTVAALMVFCVFAMSVFAVLTLGAGAYRSIAEKPRQGYDERACLSYIWTKVKNGDDAGKVYIGELHGLPALCIDEEYENIVYHTMIYHYNGCVYELFFEDGYEYRPEEGVSIFPNKSLLLEQTNNRLIKVSAGSESVFISPRGKTGTAVPKGGTAG